jgi:hypothetical protein
MVQTQTDLPLALRKENLLALAICGDRYREKLLERVNWCLRQCKFSQETFTGTLKVDFPVTMLDEPDRILEHVIAGWVRIKCSGKNHKFGFLGKREDRVTTITANLFRDPKIRRFSIFRVSFLKKVSIPSDRSLVHLVSETPHRTALRIFPLQFHKTPGLRFGKFHTSIEDRDRWKYEIFVNCDRGYFLRPLHHSDIRGIKKQVPALELFLLTALKRTKSYPMALVSVLCHLEGETEVIDAIPRYRLKFSQDVEVECEGGYNIEDPEKEWRKLEYEETEEPWVVNASKARLKLVA